MISTLQESLHQIPPQEAGPFRTSELVDLEELDDSFLLDIRYASSNNFVGAPGNGVKKMENGVKNGVKKKWGQASQYHSFLK